MPDLPISTRIPQTNDSEALLLARAIAGPVSAVGLASAARTVTTNTADILTRGFNGITAFLNVSAVPGLGGLRVGLALKDPVDGTVRTLVHSSTLITTTGLFVVQFARGVGSLNGATIPTGQCALAGVQLTSCVQLSVVHTTADSYTYKLNYELTP